ncbi:hypothetical protein DFR58_105159 [Anaerobacterium chartisolvens]|uniref:Uncharacterized protein n=1 Tax=Anaerobacterium chartisolvens TaxID=1297424 RepID=A0A369BAP5_9FIRM|nr:CBO0543 family protein [Anaerobacterium chartisolvens]RCX18395.1 hypothetical protein DFR58_105159 [Anaerobacterium chartisolvens]
MSESESFQKLLELQDKVVELQTEHWLKFEIFTAQFWLLVAMLILPWFIWWRFADKKRLAEILIYGLLVETVAAFLDELGCQLNLWEYHYDIEPLFPRLISMNFTMLPIGYMLIYQYFTRWKPFIWASLVTSVLFSFVGEPLFVWIGIYRLIKWNSFFSLPIYFIIAVSFKVILNAVMKAQRKALETKE